jgi:hypothetical protein
MDAEDRSDDHEGGRDRRRGDVGDRSRGPHDASATVRFDGDGLPDTYEVAVARTDPLDRDADSAATDADEGDDGVPDGGEDFDADRLITYAEFDRRTDPFAADTGVPIETADYAGGVESLREQVASGRLGWDVVDMTLLTAYNGVLIRVGLYYLGGTRYGFKLWPDRSPIRCLRGTPPLNDRYRSGSSASAVSRSRSDSSFSAVRSGTGVGLPSSTATKVA